MKRALLILFSAACVFALSACGEKGSEAQSSAESTAAQTQAQTEAQSQASAQGNAAAFSMSKEQLSSSLKGTWVSQADYTEKLRFEEDLTFTLFLGGSNSKGEASIDETSGILSVKYSDGVREDKSFIWVDSQANLSANTWYIDGGTFALGNTIYIRDLEI